MDVRIKNIATVQRLLSLQVVVFCRLTTAQVSSCRLQVCVVHALPVLGQSALVAQLPPQPAIGVFRHAPVITSQLSAVQLFWSLQFLALPGVQVPFVQRSLVVQALPSEHALPPPKPPPPMGVNTQFPVLALQVSFVHWLPSLQTLAPLPMQVPPVHALADVHAFLSSHTVPSVLTTELQVDVVRLQNAWTHVLAGAGQSASVAQKLPQPAMGVNTQLPLF